MRLLPAFLLLVGLTLGFAMPVAAQEEGLARDFEKLSAKERARIAKEEQEAARVDVAFQAVMAQAEDLFRQVRYEESMAKFKEARTMRPYNVYPKVKIQDLQALIAKRDAAAAATATVPEPVMQSVAPVEPPVPVAQPSAEIVPLAKPEPVVSSRLVISDPLREPTAEVVRSVPPPMIVEPLKVAPAPMVSPPAQVKSTVVVQRLEAPVLIEGQRVYKEGRSVVVENTIVQKGHLVIFRKVSHPWGEVNYFREGVPVSARAYQQAMEGR